MKAFQMHELVAQKEELAGALREGAVAITDNNGRIFGYFLDPDEFAGLKEVAEIAKDPALYNKTISAYSSKDDTITFSQAFRR